MKPYVLVPNKHPQLASALIDSFREHDPSCDIVIVADDHETQWAQSLKDNVLVTTIRAPKHPDGFCFSRNVNIGLRFDETRDVILMNDDVTLVEPIIARLVDTAKRIPTIGVLSPLIDGGVGNPYQASCMKSKLFLGDELVSVEGHKWDDPPVCFVCVYLRRRMLHEVGPFDENLVGYGFDDNDYCIRARKDGWKTCIIGSLTVKHGSGGPSLVRGINWSLSFAKEDNLRSNHEYFQKKHNPKAKP